MDSASIGTFWRWSFFLFLTPERHGMRKLQTAMIESVPAASDTGTVIRKLSVVFLSFFAPQSVVGQRATDAPVYRVEVLHTFPHDPTSFTQGLEFRNGYLYEGTGLNGRSRLRREELETGHLLNEIPVDSEYFGEGITVLNRQVIQLTWQSHIGFVYDRSSFQRLRTFSYAGEGWGLTNDGRTIYMSDGTSQLRLLDGTSLQELKRITVHEGAKEVEELNELEWIRGEIWANVWRTDRIVRISPRDGTVLGWIDLSGLLTAQELANGADVLNGIAYDAGKDRVYVTGKLWPKLFHFRVVPKN